MSKPAFVTLPLVLKTVAVDLCTLALNPDMEMYQLSIYSSSAREVQKVDINSNMSSMYMVIFWACNLVLISDMSVAPNVELKASWKR